MPRVNNDHNSSFSFDVGLLPLLWPNAPHVCQAESLLPGACAALRRPRRQERRERLAVCQGNQVALPLPPAKPMCVVLTGRIAEQVYKQHVDPVTGEPTAEYWEWALAGWANPDPVRFPMGRGTARAPGEKRSPLC